MSEPNDLFGPTPDELLNRANWLGRYLEVEKTYDTRINAALHDAADAIDEAFGSLTKDNISSKVRRAQLGLAHNAIRKRMKELFGNVGDIIGNGRQDAAVAAVNAGLYDQRGVLASIFKNPTDRQQYADSLRQSAGRNIDAVITRELVSAKPLSERVYHTTALANGQVNLAINRALAKGDSARDLAKSVTNLIRPDVPGGVSYAAKRLGRTEINNAFHAQSIQDAQDVPWIQQMEWNLSKTHKEDPGDECETYAHTKLFAVESVPEKPHPQCRCFVTPVQMDYEAFEHGLLSGQYDGYIDSVMGKGAAQEVIAPVAPEPVAPEPITPGEVATVTPIKKVSWTGPKVAKPLESKTFSLDEVETDVDLENSAFDSDLDSAWTSTEFDEMKPLFREGARTVQREGYSGLTPEQRKEHYQAAWDYETPGLDSRTEEMLRTYGKEIVARAVHSDVNDESFWRGMQLTPEDAEKFEPGQAISMPLSSFTNDIDFAENFSTGNFHWQSEDVPEDATPVVLELLPGSKTADMYYGEHVAFGQFNVVGVVDDPINGIRRVQIQQTSMIERDVERKAAKASDKDVPDIEFIDEPPPDTVGKPRPAAQLKKNADLQKHLEDHVFPKTRIVGMDDPSLDPKVSTEFAAALERLADRYPAAAHQLTSVGFGDSGGPTTYGYTQDTGYPKAFERTKGQSSRIVLNQFMSQNHKTWKSLMTKNVKDDYHPIGAEKKPVEAVVTHEFGHVITYMFNGADQITSKDLREALFEAYDDSHPLPEDKTGEKLNQWILDSLSGYSFRYGQKEPGNIFLDEALAEAFSQVELGRGNIAEKALHKLLTDRYQQHYGGY